MSELAEQVARLVYDQQQLRIEWTDTLDKISRWANRQAARDRHALAKLASGADPTATPANGEIVDSGAFSEDEARAREKARLYALLRGGGR